ncbi:hypothetical protein CRYUN_Cryun36dG0103000 [Craigia yunnanensis]
MLHFFYNCTLFPPSLPSIVCLQYNAKNSYVFTEGAIPEFDWNTYCESTVTVPVIEKAVNGVLSNSFAGAQQEGFELTLQQPDVACQSCEANGGFCGYSALLFGSLIMAATVFYFIQKKRVVQTSFSIEYETLRNKLQQFLLLLVSS